MKTIWIKIIPWKKEVFTTALESGVDAALIPDGFEEKARELGILKIISSKGDLRLSEDVVEVQINSKEDERKAVTLSKSKTLIVKTSDWQIIPLENLIAEKTNPLIAEVQDEEETRLAIQILEKGVDGILLDTDNLNVIKRCVALIKEEETKLDLASSKITKVLPLGMGDRVCIDTCTQMKIGEGMLVGNSSGGMFLVHSESVENPYVNPRPFRVNAGAVHAYTLTPGNKTRYLQELNSGDQTLIVRADGSTQTAIVGRIKIEKRPLLLVEAEGVSLILQNAETIRLVKPDGSPISVVQLKEGDEVLTYKESAGRHFGIKIEETIEEK